MGVVSRGLAVAKYLFCRALLCVLTGGSRSCSVLSWIACKLPIVNTDLISERQWCARDGRLASFHVTFEHCHIHCEAGVQASVLLDWQNDKHLQFLWRGECEHDLGRRLSHSVLSAVSPLSCFPVNPAAPRFDTAAIRFVSDFRRPRMLRVAVCLDVLLVVFKNRWCARVTRWRLH